MGCITSIVKGYRLDNPTIVLSFKCTSKLIVYSCLFYWEILNLFWGMLLSKDIGTVVISVICFVIYIGFPIVSVTYISRRGWEFIKWAYKIKVFDFPVAVISFLSMAVFVWLADRIEFIRWNLFLIWITIQIVAFIVRSISKSMNDY